MLFTSEQVSAGHPDKICDQISDAVVTDCLKRDRNSRVAVEALIKENHVVVAGEITSKHEPDIRRLVRSVLMFTEPVIYDDFDLQTFITRQSEDIALGVDKKGAGDQGSVFGYATNETYQMLLLRILQHENVERIGRVDRLAEQCGTGISSISEEEMVRLLNTDLGDSDEETAAETQAAMSRIYAPEKKVPQEKKEKSSTGGIVAAIVIADILFILFLLCYFLILK